VTLPRPLSLAATAALVAAAAGCTQKNDLDQPCTLVKKDAGDPTGRTAIPILEGEIPNTRTDFISFGSPDCDDLICVRDANFPRNADAGAPALGYCSTPCDPGISGQCNSGDGNFDNNAQLALNCRPLLLDKQTLANICAQDAGACQQYFSNTRTPTFCARGAAPDGGADGG
jgi:hypothetical protein